MHDQYIVTVEYQHVAARDTRSLSLPPTRHPSPKQGFEVNVSGSDIPEHYPLRYVSSGIPL